MASDNPKVNKTVSRAIDILDYIATTRKPTTLSEISKELSIPKSSAFDIMHTLEERKMLKFHDERKSFSLDVKSFEIGSAFLTRSDIHSIARPLLKDLSTKTSETAFLAVPNNGMIVYLDKVEGTSPTRTTCLIGDRNTMHSTGLGKAMLATMPIETLRLITGGGALQQKTSLTISNFNDLMIELERTRQRGFSIDDREDVDMVFCIGAPILNQNMECIAAISISMIYRDNIDDIVARLSPMIMRAALTISNQFGYVKPFTYPENSYDLQ